MKIIILFAALCCCSCTYQLGLTKADLREHKPKFKLLPREIRATTITGFAGACLGAEAAKRKPK